MTTIKQRRGTAAQWTSANPVLAAGEPGFETDTGNHKIGDGTTAWNSLLPANHATYLTQVGGAAAGGTGTNPPALGGFGWFLTDGAAKVIAGTDYVQLHQVLANTAAVPRVWCLNPVAVKNVANAGAVGGTSAVYGIEVSVTNNTAEAATPQANGDISGIYVSYINATGKASAALSIGGLSAGWNNGIWIDGIAVGGTGISLHNLVGGGSPAVGIDLSNIATYTTAAIALGNTHRIRAKKTAGAIRDLAQINNVDEMVFGDSANPEPVRIYASALKLNTPTAAGATAGTNGAPPAQVQGYFIITNPFQDVKVPFYNV